MVVALIWMPNNEGAVIFSILCSDDDDGGGSNLDHGGCLNERGVIFSILGDGGQHQHDLK